MRLLTNGKKIIHSFFNIPNIPDSLRNIREPILLHISDVPVSYHTFIYRVIDELQPDYLIHTGDLVDNIKLEKNPQLADFYIPRVIPFIRRLESSPIQEIYIVPGNHDHLPTIKKACRRCWLIEEGSALNIENTQLNLAHHPWNLGAHGHFYLYGHNFDEIPDTQESVYLNGLNRMHVILLNSMEVIDIDYPYGINQDRKMNTNRYL